MLPDAYFAGFFDADGCIHIGKRASPYADGQPWFRFQCQIAQVDRNVLARFHERFGGSVRGEGRKQVTSTGNPIYVWGVVARDADAFLAAVLPFLVLKRERAELALEFRQLFVGENAMPRRWLDRPHVRAKCEALTARRLATHEQMALLNQRGRSAPGGGVMV